MYVMYAYNKKYNKYNKHNKINTKIHQNKKNIIELLLLHICRSDLLCMHIYFMHCFLIIFIYKIFTCMSCGCGCTYIQFVTCGHTFMSLYHGVRDLIFNNIFIIFFDFMRYNRCFMSCLSWSCLFLNMYHSRFIFIFIY